MDSIQQEFRKPNIHQINLDNVSFLHYKFHQTENWPPNPPHENLLIEQTDKTLSTQSRHLFQAESIQKNKKLFPSINVNTVKYITFFNKQINQKSKN